MTRPFSINRAAEDEADAAADRYEAEGPGLGFRFASEVARVIGLVCDAPAIGVRIDRAGRRRVVLEGFPYDVVYRVEGETIHVLAVAHQKRRPGYNRSRG